MPVWQNNPPTDLGRSGYRLLRTPPANPMIGYVISQNLTGCRTHFIGNRTVPCESPNCDVCDNGVSWRWHAYLLVLVEATQETIIFETTAAAAQSFAAYHQRHGTTRGCYFKASRANSKPNGRVLIQCRPADLAKVNLPRELDVQKLLCHIWNIAPNQTTTPDHMARPPFRDIKVDRARSELRPADTADPQPARLYHIDAAPGRNGESPK